MFVRLYECALSTIIVTLNGVTVIYLAREVDTQHTCTIHFRNNYLPPTGGCVGVGVGNGVVDTWVPGLALAGRIAHVPLLQTKSSMAMSPVKLDPRMPSTMIC